MKVSASRWSARPCTHWHRRGDADRMAAAPTTAPDVTAMFDTIAAGNNEGMTPEATGVMVADAIRDEQFWVLPNAAEVLPLVRADLAELLANADGVDHS